MRFASFSSFKRVEGTQKEIWRFSSFSEHVEEAPTLVTKKHPYFSDMRRFFQDDAIRTNNSLALDKRYGQHSSHKKMPGGPIEHTGRRGGKARGLVGHHEDAGRGSRDHYETPFEFEDAVANWSEIPIRDVWKYQQPRGARARRVTLLGDTAGRGGGRGNAAGGKRGSPRTHRSFPEATHRSFPEAPAGTSRILGSHTPSGISDTSVAGAVVLAGVVATVYQLQKKWQANKKKDDTTNTTDTTDTTIDKLLPNHGNPHGE
jgi:hypothetical protein